MLETCKGSDRNAYEDIRIRYDDISVIYAAFSEIDACVIYAQDRFNVNGKDVTRNIVIEYHLFRWE